MLKAELAIFLIYFSTIHADSVHMFAFDWDGNLAQLSPKVVLFNKNDGSEKIISAEDFALSRSQIEINYPNYEIRNNRQNPELSSFRFTDALDRNYFLDAVRETLDERKNGEWQSRQWGRFVRALSNEKTRPYVSIITSRGHPPSHVMDGLEHLRQLGWLNGLPDLYQIHTVSYKYSSTSNLESVAAKVFIISEQLDRLSKIDSTKPHYYEFSDDSSVYLDAIKSHILKQKSAGRWSNINIVITQTLGEAEVSWIIDKEVRILEEDKDDAFQLHDSLNQCQNYLVRPSQINK